MFKLETSKFRVYIRYRVLQGFLQRSCPPGVPSAGDCGVVVNTRHAVPNSNSVYVAESEVAKWLRKRRIWMRHCARPTLATAD